MCRLVVKDIFRIMEVDGSLEIRQAAFVQCDGEAIGLEFAREQVLWTWVV